MLLLRCRVEIACDNLVWKTVSVPVNASTGGNSRPQAGRGHGDIVSLCVTLAYQGVCAACHQEAVRYDT